MAQELVMGSGRSFGMTAVLPDLSANFEFQLSKGGNELLVAVRKANGAIYHSFERADTGDAVCLFVPDTAQMRELVREASHDKGSKGLAAFGKKQVVILKPHRNAFAHHVGSPDDRRPMRV